jgi:hypothetical protein
MALAEDVSAPRADAFTAGGRFYDPRRLSAGSACASRPALKRPLPPHHGQVTRCDSPPRVEITMPVPLHGVQVERAPSSLRSSFTP